MANGIDALTSRSLFIVTPLLVAFAMLQGNNHAAEALLSGLSVLGTYIRRASKAPVVNREMESLTCLMLQVYSKDNPTHCSYELPRPVSLAMFVLCTCSHRPNPRLGFRG